MIFAKNMFKALRGKDLRKPQSKSISDFEGKHCAHCLPA
jgi:hypothetical protein